VNVLSLREKMGNHSHMLVQYLKMIGKPLFYLFLALLMFRVRIPGFFFNYMEDYKPFLSLGFVSINDSSKLKPVQILRYG
jgi:hypothetical protein